MVAKRKIGSAAIDGISAIRLFGAGAAIAASLWTLCITALLNSVNLFEYLGFLQRFADDVRAHPEKWLPWNYQQRVNALTNNGVQAPPTPTGNRTQGRRRADAIQLLS